MATDPNKMRIENVRLSYPQLFVAKQVEEGKGEPKFSCTLLLDKVKHASAIAQLRALIDRVALDQFKKKVPLKHICLHDGNEKSDKEGYGDEVMFVTTSSDRRPVVVDRDLSPLAADDAKPYAGCYVNASFRVFAWEHKTGGRGVSAGLLAVQFVKDGDAFGAGPINPEDEFDTLDEQPGKSALDDY